MSEVDWREVRDALDCARRLKGYLEKWGYTLPKLDVVIERLDEVKDPPKVVLNLGDT